MKVYKPHLSSIGDTAANYIAVACYVVFMLFWSFAVVPLLLILLLEKKSGLVRFHALQCLLLWLVRTLFGGDLAFLGLAAVLTKDAGYMQVPFGWAGDLTSIIVHLALSLLLILVAVAGIYHAYRWHAWRVPLLGWLAVLICSVFCKAAYTGGDLVPEDCRMAFSKKHSRYYTGDEAEDEEPAMAWEAIYGSIVDEAATAEDEEPAPAGMAAGGGARQAEEDADGEAGTLPAAPKGRYRLVAATAATGRTMSHTMRDRPDDGEGMEPLLYEERTPLLERPLLALKKAFGFTGGSKVDSPADEYAPQPGEAAAGTGGAEDERAGGWAAAPMPAAAPEAATAKGKGGKKDHDPNRSLPLDMRDPPMPADML